MKTTLGWFLPLARLLAFCGPLTPIPASSTPEAARPSPSTSRQPGATFVSPVDGATLVYIPAGEYIMETDRGMTDEAPAHGVYLAGFWLDRTEVTYEARAVSE